MDISLKYFTPLFVLLLSACGGGAPNGPIGASTNVVSTQISSQVLTTSIRSEQVGVDYNLKVYLPIGYQSSRSYPIIYALDGDTNFINMTSVMDLKQTPAILIGIGRSDRRTQDYNFPGVYNYYRFLTLELIPFVESKYSLSQGQRTLEGHSFGGLFVGFALFQDRINSTHYFSAFIAQEGAFSVDTATQNSIYALENQAYAVSGGVMPVTVILSGANCCYFKANQQLYDQLTSRQYQGLKLHLLQYNQEHGSMFLDSFQDSLKLLFPN